MHSQRKYILSLGEKSSEKTGQCFGDGSFTSPNSFWPLQFSFLHDCHSVAMTIMEAFFTFVNI